jgi:YVTN family beta-propeller protein
VFDRLSRREFIGDTAKAGGVLTLLSATDTAAAKSGMDGGSDDGGGGGADGDANGERPIQAPALPGASAISEADRVYTADQSSNTVSVIDPSASDGGGEALGTIPLGERRLDGVLGPVDTNQVNVHGLGLSRDGRFVDAVSVTSNGAQVIDTSSNEIETTSYVGRAPHEGFISPDGEQLWVAVRGRDYAAVIDREDGEVIDRIETADGASKVVFSPDGERAYVNHVRETVLAVIDVASREVIERVDVPAKAGPSADLAASPDGEEIWPGHPIEGYATVIDAEVLSVKAFLESGPRTNHPNFLTFEDAAYTYLTIGGENVTKVYRRSEDYDGQPERVETIENTGVAPHGIWPSPDDSRIYVALQKSDAVDVIDTESREVINALDIGQDPQALIYVARDPEEEGNEEGWQRRRGRDRDPRRPGNRRARRELRDRRERGRCRSAQRAGHRPGTDRARRDRRDSTRAAGERDLRRVRFQRRGRDRHRRGH